MRYDEFRAGIIYRREFWPFRNIVLLFSFFILTITVSCEGKSFHKKVDYFFDTERVWLKKGNPFYTGVHLTYKKHSRVPTKISKAPTLTKTKERKNPFHHTYTQYSFILGWREDCNLDKSSKILWDQQIHFPTFGRYVATGTYLKRWQKNSLLTTNRGVIFKEKIILSWNSRDIFEAYGLYVNYTFIQKKFQKRRKQGNAYAFPSYSSWDFGFLCYWEF